MARDYKKEYQDFHGKPEEIRRRSSRNKARRKMVRAGLAHKGDGKDVDHRDGNPMHNSGNLRMMSRHANRAKH